MGDADILGLSAANAAAALSGTFVVNGSPTQTAMADRAGARSQIAQLVFAGVVVLVLLFLTGPLQYLPRCVLASIVFAIAVGMAVMPDPARHSPRKPGRIFFDPIVTAASVVAIGVEQGILLAIALSLFRHVHHSYRPHTLMLVPNAAGRWAPVAAVPGQETEPGLIIYRFSSDLFYANANRFVDEVRGACEARPDAGPLASLSTPARSRISITPPRNPSTICWMISLGSRSMSCSRVSVGIFDHMDRHRITEAVGEARIFTTLHEAIAAARGDVPGMEV